MRRKEYRFIKWFAGIEKGEVRFLEDEEAKLLKDYVVRYYSHQNIYDIVKERVVKRLKTIIEFIEKGEFQKVKELLTESSAGDGFGMENYFIDFSDVANDLLNNDIEDIHDVISFLKEMKALEEGLKK